MHTLRKPMQRAHTCYMHIDHFSYYIYIYVYTPIHQLQLITFIVTIFIDYHYTYIFKHVLPYSSAVKY